MPPKSDETKQTIRMHASHAQGITGASSETMKLSEGGEAFIRGDELNLGGVKYVIQTRISEGIGSTAEIYLATREGDLDHCVVKVPKEEQEKKIIPISSSPQGSIEIDLRELEKWPSFEDYLQMQAAAADVEPNVEIAFDILTYLVEKYDGANKASVQQYLENLRNQISAIPNPFKKITYLTSQLRQILQASGTEKRIKDAIHKEVGESNNDLVMSEAVFLAGAEDSNITPKLLGSGEANTRRGRKYIVAMEFIEGDNLDEWIDSVRTDSRLVTSVEVLKTLCAGYTYIHKKGAIGDPKPANVKINNGKIRLIDVGTAIRDGSHRHTAQPQQISLRVIRGTPGYTAPEMQGATKVADIYGLGAIAYRMLSGKDPSDPEDIEEGLDLLVNTGSIPPKLAEILKKATKRIPSERYQDVATLQRELDSVRLVVLADEVKAIMSTANFVDRPINKPTSYSNLAPNRRARLQYPGGDQIAQVMGLFQQKLEQSKYNPEVLLACLTQISELAEGQYHTANAYVNFALRYDLFTAAIDFFNATLRENYNSKTYPPQIFSALKILTGMVASPHGIIKHRQIPNKDYDPKYTKEYGFNFYATRPIYDLTFPLGNYFIKSHLTPKERANFCIDLFTQLASDPTNDVIEVNQLEKIAADIITPNTTELQKELPQGVQEVLSVIRRSRFLNIPGHTYDPTRFPNEYTEYSASPFPKDTSIGHLNNSVLSIVTRAFVERLFVRQGETAYISAIGPDNKTRMVEAQPEDFLQSAVIADQVIAMLENEIADPNWASPRLRELAQEYVKYAKVKIAAVKKKNAPGGGFIV